jgi:hypothetical protein
MRATRQIRSSKASSDRNRCSSCKKTKAQKLLTNCANCQKPTCNGPEPAQQCLRTNSLCVDCYQTYWAFCNNCGHDKQKDDLAFCIKCKERAFCIAPHGTAGCLTLEDTSLFVCDHCSPNTHVSGILLDPSLFWIDDRCSPPTERSGWYPWSDNTVLLVSSGKGARGPNATRVFSLASKSAWAWGEVSCLHIFQELIFSGSGSVSFWQSGLCVVSRRVL